MSHSSLDLDDPRGEIADALFEARAVIEAQLRRTVPYVDVGDVERRLPLVDEAELGPAERDELLRGVNETTGLVLGPEVLDDETSLDDLAHALAVSTLVNRWQVTVTFAPEEGYGTIASAVLRAGLDRLGATGEAHKNPSDPYVADVGHQVAAARALAELSRQLLEVATTRISEWDENAEQVTS